LNLTGRLTGVTGAASGIGFAIAKRFAEHGAIVHLLDMDGGKVEEVADLIKKSGHKATAHPCDVSDEASVVATFNKVGVPVDILINCAGIAHIGNLASTAPADLDRLFAVNVRGVYLCMRAVIGTMADAKRGIILNIASIAATRGI